MISPCERIASQMGLLFTCEPVDGYVKIQTPFLYPDGDVIDLFYKENGDTAILTDFGETLRWLRMQTISQRRSPRQQQLITDICLTHDIKFHQGMFSVQIKRTEDMAETVIRLSQVLLKVADLWFTFRGRAEGFIIDEVEDLFKEYFVQFERSPHVYGRSRRLWRPDFRIKQKQHGALVNVLSTGSRAASRNIAVNVYAMWHDLNHLTVGQDPLKFVSLFDDTVDVWNEEDLNLVGEVSDIAYWSRIDEFFEKIA